MGFIGGVAAKIKGSQPRGPYPTATRGVGAAGLAAFSLYFVVLPLPTPTPPVAALLPTLLDLSLAGVVCYTPVLDGAGQVVDFAFAYLNPAAQRLLGVPAHLTASYLQQFPEARTNGAFVFHRDTFLVGGPAHFELNYQADGYDNYFRVAAQRVGASCW